MKYTLLILSIFLSLMAHSQTKPFEKYTFREALSECKMTFKMPRGFSESPLTQDRLYHYAIIDSATRFEARYLVRPYHLLEDTQMPINDSTSYKSFVSVLSSISATKVSDSLNIAGVDPRHAKIDFNADYGLTAFFRPAPEFSTSSNNCLSFLIKKTDIGEIYIFMLFNIINHETKVIIGDILGSVNWK